jgi:GNAT superfamily N-acetyltransferase
VSDPFTVRLATVEDIPTILAQRRAMFHDMGVTDSAALEGMEVRFGPWVRHKMEQGEFLTWLAEDGRGNVVAGAGLWLQEWPPTPSNVVGRRGYVLNVYTHPDYRRRGLARRLMLTVEEWCREHAVPVLTLHASPDGQPLYESLGFGPTNLVIKRLIEG